MLNISEKDYRPLAERAILAFTRKVFAGFFSEDEIDDLISEVVLRMWAKRERFDENRGTVNAWVYKIARNIVLDAAKREKRSRSLFSSATLEEGLDDEGNVVGIVPVASDETDAQAIAHDTERAFRAVVSKGRDGRLLNGLILGYDAAELAAAENVGTPVIHTAVCRLRGRLRSVEYNRGVKPLSSSLQDPPPLHP